MRNRTSAQYQKPCLCAMGDSGVVFCRQFDQFEIDNVCCGRPLCPYRLYTARTKAFEELRRYV